MVTISEFDELSKHARHCLRKRDFDGAIEHFERAIEVDESSAAAHEGLATAYFLKKDYDQAARHFERASRLDPNRGKSLINLGAVHNCMGQYAKAAEALRRGLQREKNCPQGFYNLGIAQRGLEQLAMAVSAYREAIRLEPQMAEAHYNLANVYFDMGNHQQAIMHYRKTLEISPEFEKAKKGLAKANGAIEEARQAVSPFGRLVDEQTARVKSLPTADRVMSQRERAEDRDRVRELSVDIEAAANDCLRHVKEVFVPALLTLHRAVTQVGEGPSNVRTALGNYRQANQRCAELRKLLKRRMLELRAHEELINTPDLDHGS